MPRVTTQESMVGFGYRPTNNRGAYLLTPRSLSL